MKTFKELSERILSSKGDLSLRIFNQEKSIIGLAEFRTVNMGEDGYIKLMFNDHSFLLMIPSSKQIFYADRILGKAEGITDEMIGKEKIIKFNGKDYKLENANDFQYTVRLYKGGPEDIEGEVKFSDYAPIDGESEILSLGWTLRNNERADINCKEIKIKEIK